MEVRLVPASHDEPEVALRGGTRGQYGWNEYDRTSNHIYRYIEEGQPYTIVHQNTCIDI